MEAGVVFRSLVAFGYHRDQGSKGCPRSKLILYKVLTELRGFVILLNLGMLGI